MYVFGRHDVHDTTMAFGCVDAGHIKLHLLPNHWWLATPIA